MKILKVLLGLILCLTLVNQAEALDIGIQREIVPLIASPTPTKIILNIKPLLKISIIPLATKAPTTVPTPTAAVVTQIVTVIPTDKEIVPTEKPTEIVVTATATPIASVSGTGNSNPMLFMAITIGALVVIVMVQALSKKKV